MNLHCILQEFVGCVSGWSHGGTLHQKEEDNLGMGEGSPEREEWGNPGLEQEGSSLELGGNPGRVQ